MIWRLNLLPLVLVFCGAAPAADPPRQLRLLPPTIELSSIESRQTLIAQWQTGDQLDGQALKSLQLESSDETIVRIDDGQAIPVANGKATIRATAGEQTATAEVTVSGMDRPFQWSFRNHVESVLS